MLREWSCSSLPYMAWFNSSWIFFLFLILLSSKSSFSTAISCGLVLSRGKNLYWLLGARFVFLKMKVDWVFLTSELVITVFLLNKSGIFILKLIPFGFNGSIITIYILTPFGTLQLTQVHLLYGNPSSTFGTSLLKSVEASPMFSFWWKSSAALMGLSQPTLMTSCGFEALQCIREWSSGSHGLCQDTVLLYGWWFWEGVVQEIGYVSSKQTHHASSSRWMRSHIATCSLVAIGPPFSSRWLEIGYV